MKKSDVLCLLSKATGKVFIQGHGKRVLPSKAISIIDTHDHKGLWRMAKAGKDLVLRTA